MRIDKSRIERRAFKIDPVCRRTNQFFDFRSRADSDDASVPDGDRFRLGTCCNACIYQPASKDAISVVAGSSAGSLVASLGASGENEESEKRSGEWRF